MVMRKILLILVLSAFAVSSAQAQLRGHGGPVRAVAVSADGKSAISGSFDTSAIRWSFDAQRRRAGAALPRKRGECGRDPADGALVTGGEDGKIAIWRRASRAGAVRGHTAPDRVARRFAGRQTIASASWDARSGCGRSPAARRACSKAIRRMSTASRSRRTGKLVSAGYDATVRIWPLAGRRSPNIVTMPTPLNAVAVAPDGEIAAAGADGMRVFLSAGGEKRGEVAGGADRRSSRSRFRRTARWWPPPASAARSRSSNERAARSRARWSGPACRSGRSHSFRTARTLLTGGTDRMVRRWDARDRRAYRRGAARRQRRSAGGVCRRSGRRGLSAPASPATPCRPTKAIAPVRRWPAFSAAGSRPCPATISPPALKKLDIVWTPETVAKLFDVGPAAYTPGTKMPEQQDRLAGGSQGAGRFSFRSAATANK